MNNIFRLIKFLKVDADDFYYVLKTPYSEMYSCFYIKKRNGKKRLIEAPIDDKLIHLQKRIKIWLETTYSKYLSKHSFGYVSDKSILDNAREHFVTGSKKYIIKIDLKDFFNTITYGRVCQLIQKGLHKSPESSKAIARIVTKDRHLPQGACTSPILSNMICKKMDRQLAYYVSKNKGIYSRYADDIFLSFESKEDAIKLLNIGAFPKIELCSELDSIIETNGFIINKTKTKFLTPNKCQNICGIVINDKINVRRSVFDDIRIKLHKLECGDTSINKSELIGKISFARFVRNVNDEKTNRYCKRLNCLIEPPFPDADFRLNLKAAFDKYIVRIENYDNDGESNDYGSGFFSKGFLITSKHVVEMKKTDDFDGPRGYFKRLIISYFDDNHRLKEEIINIVDAFYFGEIAFLKIDKIDCFKNKFLKISPLLENEPANAYCCGCQINDRSGLGIQFEKRQIIGSNNYHSSKGYTLQRGSILKGMSGAPLIDAKTFAVIGVNFEGHDSGDINTYNSVSSVLDKTKFKEMKKWEPTELWLLKHKEW